jgi:hypothetical protein
MTFIVKPGRNKVLAAAWAGLEKQRKAEKKEKPEPTEAPKKTAKKKGWRK